jgi:uncharacterized membrane protein (DUF4010 family)
MGAAIFVLALATLSFRYLSPDGQPKVDGTMFDNPLDISFVLELGALLAALIVAAKLIGRVFGEAGVLGLAGIAGFVDVDPITLAAARLGGTSLTIGAAAKAILLAAAANMVTKMVIAVSVGGFRFGWKLVLAGLLALVSGATAFFWLGVP